MHPHQSQQQRTGPRFSAGGGAWSRPAGPRRRRDQSDSDTERGHRSISRSDLSSRRNSATSPEDRITGSFESFPDAPYWSAKRHLTCGNPTAPPWSAKTIPWRGSSPGKLKTANAALVLCLNIEVDPPDVVKTNPCAVLECWVDPHTMPSHKALEAIGSNLQHQFEGLSMKISYKPILDPSLEDLRRFCQTLRKQAKDDAVLFYYNGHGVPKPTASGELWCFNRNYTQYIPVSLQEVQSWLGSPGVYIWDCSAAGHLLQNFNAFAERRDQEVKLMHGGYTDGQHPMMDSLQLAACAANEQLPSCPELPADVFTSCLTSPIDIALRYFIMNHQLPNNITADMVMQLPGELKDRRTPLGELNWLFTAITDTIAWTTFSRDIFTRLYRCDLLIASLFRNFLLAERIMKNYHCTPHTWPPLPPTNTHPLWATWDLAVDACLRQLPDLLFKVPEPSAGLAALGSARAGRIGQNQTKHIGKTPDKPYAYLPSRFFADQLTAFEVWISRGGSALTKRGPMSLPHDNRFPNAADMSLGAGTGPNHHLVPRKPPDQLPIVLQVLLSQPHRLRALILLSQFVDLGPWAVHLVLTIGIFPYISKLLQAAGPDLRPVLIFIWARILAVDPSVQTDLFNTTGFKYFAQALALRDDGLLPNSSEHKAMCSFILAAISRDFPNGQAACWTDRVFDSCYDRLEEPDFLLRQWTALCIAQMWDANHEIKVYGVDRGTQDKLVAMLSDDSAEVRAAALYALGTFMGASGSADPKKRGGGGTGTMYQLEERVHFRMEVAVATGATLAIKDDASPMCRKELLVVISCLVHEWRGYFVVCAWIYWEEDRKWRTTSQGGGYHAAQQHDEDFLTNTAVAEWLDTFAEEEKEENRVLLSSFFTIFVVVLDLSVDSYSEVATMAQTIVDYIMALLLESPFKRLESTSLDIPPITPSKPAHQHPSTQATFGTRSRRPSLQGPLSAAGLLPLTATRPPPSRSDTMTSTLSGVSSTLRRSPSIPSIASTLKNIANGIMFPSSSSGTGVINEEAVRTAMLSPLATSSFTPNNLPLSGSRDHPVDISRPPSPNLNLARYASPYGRDGDEDEGESETDGNVESPDGSSANGHGFGLGQEQEQQGRFSPCDVMEALMLEDLERLRARRRLGLHPAKRAQYEASRSHHGHGHHQYYAHGHGQGGHHYYQGGSGLPSPSNSTFSVDSNSSIILGLGTGAGIKDVLPLKSGFYDWCCEYFKEPQMRQTEADEPGSVEYNYQVWRQQRNEQVLGETMQQSMYAHTCRWDRPVSHFQVSTLPLTMRFHAYDPHLIMANEADMISVWDWSQRKRINYFCNGNAKGTTITAMHLINQDVGGIVVTGASDGVVRLYRNYDSSLDQGSVQMVSAFRALNEVIQVRQGAGLVMDWKQSAGSLLVGGDARIIKVWDAQTENASAEIETGSDSPLTAIESDPTHTQHFIAGFGDGIVKLFDRRLDEDEETTTSRHYIEHTSWIQNVKWNPSSSYQFYSASIDGEVKLWDIRRDTPIKAWNVHAQGLSAWDAHPLTPVFAASSAITSVNWRSQRVVVHAAGGSGPLSTFNIGTGLTLTPHRAMPSTFIPRTSSLVFHPMEMLYALGQPDGSVRIMGCKLP